MVPQHYQPRRSPSRSTSRHHTTNEDVRRTLQRLLEDQDQHAQGIQFQMQAIHNDLSKSYAAYHLTQLAQHAPLLPQSEEAAQLWRRVNIPTTPSDVAGTRRTVGLPAAAAAAVRPSVPLSRQMTFRQFVELEIPLGERPKPLPF